DPEQEQESTRRAVMVLSRSQKYEAEFQLLVQEFIAAQRALLQRCIEADKKGRVDGATLLRARMRNPYAAWLDPFVIDQQDEDRPP
ncbi:unnamed protein product, partial [Amoebophrya sp. A25]